MKIASLRSPHDTIGGIVYFGRMLDKIRINASVGLPPDYQENLGTGFDGRCVQFLQIDYSALIARTRQGGTDEDLLQWCFAQGHHPSEVEVEMWNNFMSKRGWRDEIVARLETRKKEAGFENRTDILTMFDFIDADEERPLRF